MISPLTVRDTARMAGISDDDAEAAAEAFDAVPLTGGYPRLVMEWRRTPSIAEFLTTQLADESTEVVTTGRRILDAEFPPDLQASVVLPRRADPAAPAASCRPAGPGTDSRHAE